MVFLQLLDSAGKPWAAEDAQPWQGRYPTSRWQAGEVVRDPHTLTLAADAPDGAYRLIAGLYRTADKQRLPLAGLLPTGDSVDLGTVQVAGSPARLHRAGHAAPAGLPLWRGHHASGLRL